MSVFLVMARYTAQSDANLLSTISPRFLNPMKLGVCGASWLRVEGLT